MRHNYALVVVTYEKQFEDTFGVPLRRFMSSITGFDVIAFDDDVIKPEDGVSTKETIQQKHGDAAVDLILNIIHSKV